MTSLRERNNTASKKSYEKAIEREYATEYEHEVVRQHRLLPDTRVWHWSVVPEDYLYDAGYIHDYSKHRLQRLLCKKEQMDGRNRLRDYGLDALAETVLPSGEVVYSGIQAKYYQSRSVTAADIGTFLQKQITMSRCNPKSKGYLYTTSKLQADLADDVAHPDFMIRHVMHPWKHTDRRSCHAPRKETAVNECDLPLRDYQMKALEELMGGGIKALNIPCRMGKTLIGGHAIRHHQPRLVVAMAPLKISVENLRERLACFMPGYASLLVDSDAGGTTDEKEIAMFLKVNEKQPIVVYTTFESAVHVLSDMKLDLSNAYVLGDEIHNATDAVCAFINTFPTGLVMSATFPEEICEKLDINNMVSVPFSKGIEGGYIVDYALWLPHLTKHKDGTTTIEASIPTEFQHYESSMVTKVLFHAVCVLKTGSRKTIVYLSSQAECDQYMEICRDVFENYHGLTVWLGKITSDVSSERRKTILNDFQQDRADAVHILTSVRILDEAVDIPACDSEFITTIGEQTSDIRFFQRAQRGSTLDPKNPNKRNNIFLWADGWEKCLGALEFLRHADPEYHKKMHVAGVNYADRKGREQQRKESMVKEAMGFVEWSRMACISVEERSKRKAEALVALVQQHGRVPTSKETVDGFKIGQFWDSVKHGLHPGMYQSMFSHNALLRADYEKAAMNREAKKGTPILSPEDKGRRLVAWVDQHGNVPSKTTQVEEFLMGQFWHSVKQGINPSVYQSLLSHNAMLRADYEKSAMKREAKKGELILSPEEKGRRLVAWVDQHGQMPKTTDDVYVQVGQFWGNVKQGLNPSVYQSLLSHNALLRADYEKTAMKREAKKGKLILSPEEKGRRTVSWVEQYGKVPKTTEEVDEFKIGQFWDNVKQGNTQSIYHSILSHNALLRADYEKTAMKREAKKGMSKLSPEEKARRTVAWVEQYGKVPKSTEEVDEFKIGQFWVSVKQRNPSIYQSILSHNALLRADYEKAAMVREATPS